jgi:hypothetical protein
MRRTLGQNESFPLDREQDVTFKVMIVLCAYVQRGTLLHERCKALLNSGGFTHGKVLK